MGSRDHPPQGNLSSMVVGPAEPVGSGGADFEAGEVRRDREQYYSRSERFSERQGYGIRAGSGSPLRHRKVDRRYDTEFDHGDAPHRSHGGFRGGRGPGRFREFSPPYGRGRGGRSFGRGLDGLDFGVSSYRGEGMSRNNPNVPPRVGDWICSEPSCGNLNFARRAYCNNCNKLRRDMAPFGPLGSPRGDYPAGPPHPHSLPPHVGGPPMDRGPGREINGYGSPPRGWSRDGFREFDDGMPPPRHGERLPDHRMGREFRDRADYHIENEYRGRGRFDGSPREWRHGMGGRWRGRDEFHERDEFFDDRREVYGRGGRRAPSPPSLPDRWVRDSRVRSRSPVRGMKEYNGDPFVGRGREDRRGIGRDRINNSSY
ncbi:TATA-binding protein-associated factor 2N [Nymphaea thermarum]|nr:TATA-binding protein-associated factor 2N [Nymphaea thermarum]